MSRPNPHRLTYTALVAGGVLLGAVGAGLSSVRLEIGGVSVPWGLVLVVVALGVGARAGAWLVGSRNGAVAVVLGWVLPTLAFSALAPGGDVLLPDVARTYVYLGGGLVAGALAMVVPLPAGAAEAAREAYEPAAGEPAAP